LIFALTMIAIGIMGLVSGTFAPIWAGVPKALPDRQALAYLSTFISLVCGAGLLANRTAAPSAFMLAIALIVWTILFKVPFIIRDPLVEVAYQSCGENAVLIAGAWMVFAADGAKDGVLGKLDRPIGQRIASVLYGLALVAFGLSHFAYVNLTAPLVPSWLGEPVFWAYFTGCIYLATGLLIVTALGARVGAWLSAVQIAIITFLVWGPPVLTGHVNAGNWEEPAVSWALTAAAWVVADSFRGKSWFGRSHQGAAQAQAAVEGAA
jgi:uncharacterized membrane protein